MASIHETVMTAVKSALVAADLDGIGSDRIHIEAIPDPTNIKYPCILCALDSVREELRPYSTEEDERVLPVQIHVLDKRDRKSSLTWLPGWLQRRQDVADAFLCKVLSSVSGNWLIDVESTSVIDGQRLLGRAYEDSAGGFTLRPSVITTRIAPG